MAKLLGGCQLPLNHNPWTQQPQHHQAPLAVQLLPWPFWGAPSSPSFCEMMPTLQEPGRQRITVQWVLRERKCIQNKNCCVVPSCIVWNFLRSINMRAWKRITNRCCFFWWNPYIIFFNGCQETAGTNGCLESMSFISTKPLGTGIGALPAKCNSSSSEISFECR